MMRTLIRWLRSLQVQLLLWAILPVALVIVALAFTGVYTHQREMRDFVAERNGVVAQLIAAQIEDGLAHGFIDAEGQALSLWLPLQNREISGALFIVDEDGKVLAYTKAQSLNSGTLDTAVIRAAREKSNESVLMMDTPNGALLVSFAPIQGTTWTVVLEEPVDALLGPILRFSGLGPSVALIAAGLSLLTLAFGWRTIVRPLQHLARASAQVSWGDHSAIEHPIRGVAEIQDLHRALHAMVERIAGYESGIRDYLDAMTQGQEAERARLARELHDGPVQELIALNQRVEMARSKAERGEVTAACSLLDDLRSAEIATIEELRRVIGDLRPIYLEDLGFVPALEMLVRTADDRSSAHVSLKHNGNLRRLCANVELAAYRITQEALNNALQHAQAQNIVVRVGCESEGVSLTIQDDGIGFEMVERPDKLTQVGHFGLMGLWERVRQLGGTLHINTAPGKGTQVQVWLPDRRGLEQCAVRAI